MIRSSLARLRLPPLPRLSVALSRPPLPRLSAPWLRLPLPCTSTAILLLVLLPALILARWSRPRAEGLEQVMGAASLLQSFPASPERPVPQLWRERLGADQARLLWVRQRGVWWQFWASHSESAPYLVLAAEPFGKPGGPLPPQAVRVGDLVVVAETATARQQLRTALRPLQRRSRGLLQRCHQRLQVGQGVFWQADALGTLLGPVAPLLERYQVGCLTLTLEGKALRWQGEAGPASVLAGAPGGAPSGPPGGQPSTLPSSPLAVPLAAPGELAPSVPPLPALSNKELLELEGSSLDQLLAGLLSRQMIRDPLAARYGLEGERLERMRRAPFRLLLLPQAEGPFQATLELLIPVGSDRTIWESVLQKVKVSLLEQGLSQAAPTAAAPAAAPTAAAPGSEVSPAAGLSSGPPAPVGAASSAPSRPDRLGADKAPTLWWRSDGSLVGGWRWLESPGVQPQLQLFLGPAPSAPPGPLKLPGSMGSSGGSVASPAGNESLRLRARPAALDALGLLGGELPGLVRRSDQVWLTSEGGFPAPLGSGKGGGANAPALSRLTGRLLLGR